MKINEIKEVSIWLSDEKSKESKFFSGECFIEQSPSDEDQGGRALRNIEVIDCRLLKRVSIVQVIDTRYEQEEPIPVRIHFDENGRIHAWADCVASVEVFVTDCDFIGYQSENDMEISKKRFSNRAINKHAVSTCSYCGWNHDAEFTMLQNPHTGERTQLAARAASLIRAIHELSNNGEKTITWADIREHLGLSASAKARDLFDKNSVEKFRLLYSSIGRKVSVKKPPKTPVRADR
jgi:hypothetical protein